MAAESKDLFAFRRGFTDLLPNRSLVYARDDSLVRNLKQLDKLPIYRSIPLGSRIATTAASMGASMQYREATVPVASST